jgi:hypothetical protein
MPETDKSLAVDKVRELRRKLYVCAKKSETRRFHALCDRITRSDVLWEAWRRVRSNGGAAGIQAALRAGRYRPSPVKRRYIPKADGKQRPLGIPAVGDRVVEMAANKLRVRVREVPDKRQIHGMGSYRLMGAVKYPVQATPRRSSLSRVREDRTHGLKGEIRNGLA